MKLSPKERRRIYEEEKARLEAEERRRQESRRARSASTLDLEPNVAGLLCYVGGWISGVVFLLLEQKNNFVRFHALQSIIVFGVLNLAGIVLGNIPFINLFFGPAIGIIAVIMWILLMVKAYNYQRYHALWAGDLADRWLARI